MILMKIFKWLFNENTGFFINSIPYDYDGKTYIGFVICQGFRFFGILGYTRISHCVDKEEVNKEIKRLKINLVV